MDSANSIPKPVWTAMDQAGSVPLWAWGVLGVVAAIGIIALAFTFSLVLAPTPRPPRSSERTYITVTANGSISKPTQLPTWYDNYAALKKMASEKQIPAEEAYQIGEAELFMTLVVPAYNEEERLEGMLEEAVEYLERQYGHHGTKSRSSSNGSLQARGHQVDQWRGWEILLVSDGSTDRTVETTLRFARTHQLGQAPSPSKGPWKGNAGTPTKILPGTIRVIQLEQNRGKGGAVTHGMRHARGRYIVFADADGASKFSDLGRLVEGCERVKDKQGRAVGVGSRAHMVGTEAVVKRSFLRNALMHSFHLLLHFMTTPQTAEIKDTQCGFKLFTRPSLPFIVPFMHSEGWIFDVEMLMLAESANIPMVEVPIGWKEVMGSKLNVIWDSLGMAWGLAILRVGWGTGFFKRE